MLTKRISALLSLVLLLLLGFQNCSDFKAEQKPQASLSHLPKNVCGIEGFEVIYTRYLKPNCASCHNGGFADPPFITDDLDFSYRMTKFMDGVALRDSFENNLFCGPDCNLTPGSPMHNFFVAWLSCR